MKNLGAALLFVAATVSTVAAVPATIAESVPVQTEPPVPNRIIDRDVAITTDAPTALSTDVPSGFQTAIVNGTLVAYNGTHLQINGTTVVIGEDVANVKIFAKLFALLFKHHDETTTTTAKKAKRTDAPGIGGKTPTKDETGFEDYLIDYVKNQAKQNVKRELEKMPLVTTLNATELAVNSTHITINGTSIPIDEAREIVEQTISQWAEEQVKRDLKNHVKQNVKRELENMPFVTTLNATSVAVNSTHITINGTSIPIDEAREIAEQTITTLNATEVAVNSTHISINGTSIPIDEAREIVEQTIAQWAKEQD